MPASPRLPRCAARADNSRTLASRQPLRFVPQLLRGAFCHRFWWTDPNDGRNLLLLAAGAGLDSLVDVLLSYAELDDAPVDVQGRSFRGETALHEAAAAGHLELCIMLLRRTCLQLSGAAAETLEGLTPLHLCPGRALEKFSNALQAAAIVSSAFVCASSDDAEELADAVVHMQRAIAAQRGRPAQSFTDVRAPGQLASVRHHVGQCESLVLLLTPGLLADPHTILAVVAAYDMGRPIVGVMCEGMRAGRYDGEAAIETCRLLDEHLARTNPAALAYLRSKRVDVEDLGRKCLNVLRSLTGDLLVTYDMHSLTPSAAHLAAIASALEGAKPTPMAVTEARSKLVIREHMARHVSRIRTFARVRRKFEATEKNRLRRVNDGMAVVVPELDTAPITPAASRAQSFASQAQSFTSHQNHLMRYHIFLSHRARAAQSCIHTLAVASELSVRSASPAPVQSGSMGRMSCVSSSCG